MALRRDYGQPQQGDTGFARTMKTYGRRVNLVAADLVTTNNVGAFKVPPGFVITGILAIASDMDTNGSPTITIKVGDAGDDDRYLTASNIGPAGGTCTTLASTGLLFQTTSETEILVGFGANAATGVAGTLDLYLTGFIL